jgi:protocatechuate 3,4-dioxygenase beta subunit
VAADLRLLSRAVPVGLILLAPAAAPGWARAEDPCARAMSKAVLVEKGEPGEALRVRGTVYRPDGVTPAAGVILYVYQTDTTGHYSRKRGEDPRLRGWMRTDEKGRYEFRTIRPAPYPSRTEPAHIHTQLWGPGVATHSNVVLLFADDPLLRPKDREESAALGRFGFIRAPVKGTDGVFEVTLDMRLQETGDTFEENILHGVKPCGVTPPSRPS